MAQQIGNLLPAVTVETASPRRLTSGLTLEAIRSLPAIPSPDQMRALQATANAELPALSPCDRIAFGQILRTMQAALPMRFTDEDSGKLLIATYHRMLGNYCREAIAYLAERSLVECKWFPTIAECREILDGWRRDDEPARTRQSARWKIEGVKQVAANMAQQQFAEDMQRLERGEMTQTEVDALPEATAWSAEARGWLRYDGGKFTLRTVAA